MIDEVTEGKIEKLALDIINMSRNKLLVNLRFLDMALNSIKASSRSDLTESASTDGQVYVYNDRFILSVYRIDENLPGRNFLHSVFHWVFKHMFVNPSVERTYWNLACDIAAESVINDLELPYLISSRSGQQKMFLDKFKDEIKVCSAERIYRFLPDKELPEVTIKGLEMLFKADDHFMWYLSDKEKGRLEIAGYAKEDGENETALILPPLSVRASQLTASAWLYNGAACFTDSNELYALGDDLSRNWYIYKHADNKSSFGVVF